MRRVPSDADLEAYLDEQLAAEEMAQLERQLRKDVRLARRLAEIAGRRDAGMHSLGAIWRRHRISCPTREQLGSYLLGALEPEHQDYIHFHLETVACRYCQANLADLQVQQQAQPQTQQRRQRYFQSSVGQLRKRGTK